MTRKTSRQRAFERRKPSSDVIVFGLDASGIAKAACFPEEQIHQAGEAAVKRGLNIQEVSSSARMAELCRQVPPGLVDTRGRVFIPVVKRRLFNQLHEASGGLVRDAADAQEKASQALGAPYNQRPHSWEHIKVGDLVLFCARHNQGYWEAIVVERDQYEVTLRYLYYPKHPLIRANALTLALLYPGHI